eukprot:1181265-Prorocentrum_minimum.AAC.1
MKLKRVHRRTIPPAAAAAVGAHLIARRLPYGVRKELASVSVNNSYGVRERLAEESNPLERDEMAQKGLNGQLYSERSTPLLTVNSTVSAFEIRHDPLGRAFSFRL